MKKIFPFLFLFFISLEFTIAQNVQWASEVVSFSSQEYKSDFSALQVLGVPNSLNDEQVSRFAWSPKNKGGSNEYIKVKFKQAIPVKQILVFENFAPGSISRIDLIEPSGKSHKVYDNKNQKPTFDRSNIFKHYIDKTSYRVNGLKLYLKTQVSGGQSQIDAIAISDSDAKIRRQINLIEYKSEIAPAENLGPTINSQYPERLPIISPDGKTLYFTRKLHPENIGGEGKDDIWFSKMLPGGQWSPARNIGTPLNDDDHNFVVAVHPDNKLIYLANEYKSNVKDGLSTSKFRMGLWSKPKARKISNHYNDNEFVSYHISVNGQVMVMAVQREDSYGDRDLYVSFKGNNGQWSEPKNMGTDVNTATMESSVFLAADGKTIYFSSAGHWGYGALDMYRSRRLDNTWTRWSKPENLGPSINSEGMDYNYTIPASGDYAYFSSDRNSYGMSDLFRIPLPEEARPDPVILVSGQFIDAETGKPIKATLVYEDLDSKDNLEELEDDNFQVVVPYGSNYGVHAEVDGYYAVGESLELSDEELEEEDYEGEKPKKNSTYNKKRNDAEIQKLKDKLNKLKSDIKKLNTEKDNISKTKKPATTPKKTTPKKSRSDDELIALKDKLDKYKNKQKSTAKPTRDNPTPKPTKPTKKTERQQSEIDKLRDKLNQHNSPKSKPEPEKEPAPEEVIGTVTDEEVEEMPPPEPKPEAPEDWAEEEEPMPDPLEPIEETELVEQVSEDLELELEEDLEGLLEETDKEEVKEEVVETIKRDIQEIEKLDNDALTEQIKNELEIRYKEKAQQALEDKLAEEMKATSEAFTPEDKDYKEVKKDIILVPIKVGQIIPLHNIFFEANEATIKDASFPELQRALDFLEKNDNLIVEIGGHTNGVCSHDFAKVLSTGRAKEVMDYFTDKGISKNRIKFRGYGKTQPIADNKTTAGRKKNQRVEMKILEILK